MAVILSAAEPTSFTPETEAGKPEDKRAVYILRTPTRGARLAFRADIRQEYRVVARDLGLDDLEYPSDSALLDALERGVRELVREEDGLAAHLEAIKAFREKGAGAGQGVKSAIEELETALADYEPYAALVRRLHIVSGITEHCALRRFVAAWRNLKVIGAEVPCEVRDGRLTEAALARIPEEHRAEVYLAILDSMAPAEAEAKN